MAGMLYHGKSFEIDEYTGNDGNVHYEIIPVDGGTEVISISNWREMVDHCASRGIDRDCWPAFNDPFDIPLEVVESKCHALREKLALLEKIAASEPLYVKSIVQHLRNDNLFFFSEE